MQILQENDRKRDVFEILYLFALNVKSLGSYNDDNMLFLEVKDTHQLVVNRISAYNGHETFTNI